MRWERRHSESTPMPNAEEPNPKSKEFSPIDNVEDTTGNTPETVKDESQAKRKCFTERLAIMVGMKSRKAKQFPRERQTPTKTKTKSDREQQPTTGQQLTMEQPLLS